jgi:uncharacterized membrane protein
MVSPENNITAKDITETGRIEAFSDGMFAIAITLLVLDIKVPQGVPEGSDLFGPLLQQWPNYLAFVISFAFIGIMWINHHRLFTHIQRADNTLLVLNLLLLFGVTAVPFPTALVAEYINRQEAVWVYSGLFLLIAVFFNLLWRYASYNNRLLDPQADRAAVNAITRQYSFGPVLYLIAFVLVWFSPQASLLLSLILALFFALPGRSLPLQGDAPE